jgi:hypothetical protein
MAEVSRGCLFVDANTGKPRSGAIIERAAKWRTSEEDKAGLRIRRWTPDSSSQTAEGSEPISDASKAAT